jgi:hypothetical protein
MNIGVEMVVVITEAFAVINRFFYAAFQFQTASCNADQRVP